LKGQKRTSVEKDDIWIFVFDRKRTRFIDLRKAFVDEGRKLSYGTFHKYRRELVNEGKIKVGIDEKSKEFYCVPPQRRKEVEALKRKRGGFFLDKIEAWPPSEQLDLLKETQRDLRINELESLPLPKMTIAKLIEQMRGELGWSVNFSRVKAGVACSPEVFDGKGEPVQVYAAYSPELDETPTSDIELKVVPLGMYASEYVGTPWKKVCEGDVKGERKEVLGAYVELKRLSEAKLDDETTRAARRWKEEFRMCQEDWKDMESTIRDMIELDYPDEDMAWFLAKHFLLVHAGGLQNVRPCWEDELTRILIKVLGEDTGNDMASKALANYKMHARAVALAKAQGKP
jgi:hypothetical protein